MSKTINQIFQLESIFFKCKDKTVDLINSDGVLMSKIELQFIPQGVLSNNGDLVFISMENRTCQVFKKDTFENRVIEVLPHSFISTNILLGTNSNGLCLYNIKSEEYLWNLNERYMILSCTEQFIVAKLTTFRTVIIKLINIQTGEEVWELDLQSKIELEKGIKIFQTGHVKLSQTECTFYLKEGLLVSVNLVDGQISNYSDLRGEHSFQSTNDYLFLNNTIKNLTEYGVILTIDEDFSQKIIDLNIGSYNLSKLVLRQMLFMNDKIIIGAQQNRKGDAEKYVQNSSLIFINGNKMHVEKVIHLNQTIKNFYFGNGFLWCLTLKDDLVKSEEIEEY